ncbi:selenium-dependent molybdenum cofactor biosynthesis protein YqeB [Isachenkonia alkalipeptolytica]|uniref:EF2563 family selenium-dependent molybdenum hydroxylase system protein n=1 Tax=Isachenkonia alkalipeptolytica TaxID=2565777 RepID=A0AA44BFV6_9CLOT|nr:selenium-dependent molybdenum cofactor biosynthesis protein YqeB [Isachenkonia alkalipeptolytica]NBG89265.1 EF2563 family selenium-dependent molybdenum hydroxylase system protein [Isachenkonia alkalipeptolytica]
MDKTKVLIRGGGDLASAVALRLANVGFTVVIAELEKPLCIRRTVSFSEAIIAGAVDLEGVKGIKVHTADIENWLRKPSKGQVAVVSDPKLQSLAIIKPDVFIEGTLRKKIDGAIKDFAPITIALGPGFEAPKDVDAVIETNRGHHLGRVYYEGMAMADTGIPGIIMGYGKERVLYAKADGSIIKSKEIGAVVEKGETVAEVLTQRGERVPVQAKISGVLRGMIPRGEVQKGLKIGDVDPRKDITFIHSVSDKGRTISGGVLEAILHLKNKQGSGINPCKDRIERRR